MAGIEATDRHPAEISTCVTAGVIAQLVIDSASWHRSPKLALVVWFHAMQMMTSTRQAVSAVELGRRLGVSYPTAWYLHKRLRHAMRQDDSGLRLGGGDPEGSLVLVEADDVTLGGERNKGRGTAGKTQAIVACERHACGRMGRVAMQVIEGFSTASVQAFRDARIVPAARVHTDGLPAFNAFGEGGRTHQRTITGGRCPARRRGADFFVVNTAIANVSTALKATHKAISPKHIPDYLAAFCWTTNFRRSMTTMARTNELAFCYA